MDADTPRTRIRHGQENGIGHDHGQGLDHRHRHRHEHGQMTIGLQKKLTLPCSASTALNVISSPGHCTERTRNQENWHAGKMVCWMRPTRTDCSHSIIFKTETGFPYSQEGSPLNFRKIRDGRRSNLYWSLSLVSTTASFLWTLRKITKSMKANG